MLNEKLDDVFKIQASLQAGLQLVDEFDEDTVVKIGFELFSALIKKDFSGKLGVIVNQKELDILEKEYGVN